MLGELFDPKADFSVHEHCRPHWSQAGTVVFITMRTADSIPKDVVQRWDHEKTEWLRQHDCDISQHWSKTITSIDNKLRKEFQKTFRRTREAFLDTCHGKCVLQKPELAKIVADSLMFFDGDRYRMGDFVVMPNHVHLLAVFGSEELLKEQCDSWMHFTARKINLQLGTKGKFWQQEPFDHLVRSPEQFSYLRDYIRDNGRKAKLQPNQYLYRRHSN